MDKPHPPTENPTRMRETHLPSPNNHSSTNSVSSAAAPSNGFFHQPSPPSPRPPHPPPALPITRSEPNNPYPTTFVQADTSSFKKVVQMLTGSVETARLASRADAVRSPIPPVKTGAKKDKSASKLYERRLSSLKSFKISPLGPAAALPTSRPGYSCQPEILSPSVLDFPSLLLSPVTPLLPDPFNRPPPHAGVASGICSDMDMEAEDKAIKEKGFYLHQSPASTPRDSEPRLLPLFPVTSPRIAVSANAAACSEI